MIGTNGNGITFSGLSSGFDSESLIKKLVGLQAGPAQRLSQQQSLLRQQKDAYSKFRTQLNGLKSSVDAFTRSGAFATTSSNSSNGNAVTITSNGSGVSNGNYSITVKSLATNAKVASRAFLNSTSSLGLSGDFSINGKTVSVGSSDTLDVVAKKINASGAGVHASILNATGGQAYLTVASDTSGAAGSIQFGQTTRDFTFGFGDNVVTTTSTVTSTGTTTATTSSPPPPPTLTSRQISSLNGSLLNSNIYSGVNSRITSQGLTVDKESARRFSGELQSYIDENTAQIKSSGDTILTSLVGLVGLNSRSEAERIAAGALGSAELDNFKSYISSQGLNISSLGATDAAFQISQYVTTRLSSMDPTDQVAWNANATAATAYDSVSSSTALANNAYKNLQSKVLDEQAVSAFSWYLNRNGLSDTTISTEDLGRSLQRFISYYGDTMARESAGTADASIGLSATRDATVKAVLNDRSSPGFNAWAQSQGLDFSNATDDQFAASLSAYALNQMVAETGGGSNAMSTVVAQMVAKAKIYESAPNSTVITTTVTSTVTTSHLEVMSSAPVSSLNLLQAFGFAAGNSTSATDGLATSLFSSVDESIAEQFAFGSRRQFNLKVGGQSVSVDIDHTSMKDLAEQIGAIDGVSARIVQSGGRYQLQIDSNSGTLDIGDPDGFLDKLGATAKTTVLTEGKDAVYTLNGVEMTSSSNTVTNAITGSTVKLQSVGQATLTTVKNSDAVVSAFKTFASSLNAVHSFVKSQSALDQKSYEVGNLFADGIAQQVGNLLSDAIFGTAGAGGKLKNVTQIGFKRNSDGDIEVDEVGLRTALDGGTADFEKLFGTSGTSTDDRITFVSGSARTKASDPGSYAVNITRAATQTSLTSGSAQTETSAEDETLTFSGAALGGTSARITLAAGSSLDDTVAAINADSKLKGIISAENVDGKLKLTSTSYGTGSDFEVTSNLRSGSANSGIGSGSQVSKSAGQDVAGTINGEAATGSGQLLMGNAGNANTDGLQIQYTGAETGLIGQITVSKGVAANMASALESITDSQTGLLSAFDASIDSKIGDLGRQIDDISKRASAKEAELRNRFAAMEAAMKRSQEQLAKIQSFSEMNAKRDKQVQKTSRFEAYNGLDLMSGKKSA